mgnify:FL=1
MAEGGVSARVGRLVGRAAGALLDWVYPRHCYHCGVPLDAPGRLVLCGDCFRAMVENRLDGNVCGRCGLPLSGPEEDGALCIGCLAQERYFDLARAFFAYAGPVTSVIKSFKFEGNYFLGPRLLRVSLARKWLPEEIVAPEGVVPVPLHPRRRRERGYDQALLLAETLAGHFDCKLVKDALVRTRYTRQQTRLTPTGRRDNVRGAFAVADGKAVEGRSLLLVDDVATTGATAEECSKALKKAGCGRLQVLTLARTAP